MRYDDNFRSQFSQRFGKIILKFWQLAIPFLCEPPKFLYFIQHLTRFVFSASLATIQQPPGDLSLRRIYATDREYFRKLGEIANLPNEEANLFAKLLVRMKRKYRKRTLKRYTTRDLKFNGMPCLYATYISYLVLTNSYMSYNSSML